eukprot:scaffold23020_cov79-Phaeocystis_antarctica.AAC.4
MGGVLSNESGPRLAFEARPAPLRQLTSIYTSSAPACVMPGATRRTRRRQATSLSAFRLTCGGAALRTDHTNLPTPDSASTQPCHASARPSRIGSTAGLHVGSLFAMTAHTVGLEGGV